MDYHIIMKNIIKINMHARGQLASHSRSPRLYIILFYMTCHFLLFTTPVFYIHTNICTPHASYIYTVFGLEIKKEKEKKEEVIY